MPGCNKSAPVADEQLRKRAVERSRASSADLSKSLWGITFSKRSTIPVLILWTISALISPTNAAFISFENCLDPNIVNSNPRQLQFTPLYFWAAFNTSSPRHNLNVTVYGNVSGIATQQALPGPDDPQWYNTSETLGKIVDLSASNNKYSTLFSKFNVLSYTPYQAAPSRFCNSSVHGECPLAPAFYKNA